MKKYAVILCSVLAVTLSGNVSATEGKGKANKMQRTEKVQKAEQEHKRQNEQKMKSGEQMRDQKASQQSKEMTERKQEREEIKQEYKETIRSGEGEKVKGKKPWWKFWGADDEE